jgi:hypothetical protein
MWTVDGRRMRVDVDGGWTVDGKCAGCGFGGGVQKEEAMKKFLDRVFAFYKLQM